MVTTSVSTLVLCSGDVNHVCHYITKLNFFDLSAQFVSG